MDDEDFLEFRRMGVEHVGVINVDTGDRWLTTVEAFSDRTKIRFHDYALRGGSLQRYLPLAFFVHRPGRIPPKL